jgi:hypothetical protein
MQHLSRIPQISTEIARILSNSSTLSLNVIDSVVLSVTKNSEVKKHRRLTTSSDVELITCDLSSAATIENLEDTLNQPYSMKAISDIYRL